MFLGLFLLFSCGQKRLSSVEVKELEVQAEKGDIEAARKLVDYYGNIILPLSMVEYKELSNKPDKTDNEKAKVEEYYNIIKNYDKWSRVVDSLSAAAMIQDSTITEDLNQNNQDSVILSPNGHKFEGTIDNKEVTLFIDNSFDDGDSIGYYYYNDRPNIKLKLIQKEFVAINAHGSMHIALDEFTPQGEYSGNFDGQLECRGSGFEGTYTDSTGKKLNFELWE